MRTLKGAEKETHLPDMLRKSKQAGGPARKKTNLILIFLHGSLYKKLLDVA